MSRQNEINEQVKSMLQRGVRQIWARVDWLGEKGTANAFTSDRRQVVISLRLKDMADLRVGDFVSFYPQPFDKNPSVLFALSPKIIGWAMDDDAPETPAHAPEAVAEQIASGETR